MWRDWWKSYLRNWATGVSVLSFPSLSPPFRVYFALLAWCWVIPRPFFSFCSGHYRLWMNRHSDFHLFPFPQSSVQSNPIHPHITKLFHDCVISFLEIISSSFHFISSFYFYFFKTYLSEHVVIVAGLTLFGISFPCCACPMRFVCVWDYSGIRRWLMRKYIIFMAISLPFPLVMPRLARMSGAITQLWLGAFFLFDPIFVWNSNSCLMLVLVTPSGWISSWWRYLLSLVIVIEFHCWTGLRRGDVRWSIIFTCFVVTSSLFRTSFFPFCTSSRQNRMKCWMETKITGLTTPFLFSNTALDISTHTIRRLITSFLYSISPSLASASTQQQSHQLIINDFRDEAKFAGPHELGMALRWGLARVVRLVRGVETRGLITWDAYLTWRRYEQGEWTL